MESSSFHIWFRRLALPVLVLLMIGGYFGVSSYLDEKSYQTDCEMALVTVKLWLAGARLRETPESYLDYRDSLLSAHDLTLDQVTQYADQYSDQPEKYYRFAAIMSQMTDSLFKIEDSLRKQGAAQDTAQTADSTVGISAE